MNLQETVSKILGKEVTAEEAKQFANDQFGVLVMYLIKPVKERHDLVFERAKNLVNVLENQLTEDALENDDIIDAMNNIQCLK